MDGCDRNSVVRRLSEIGNEKRAEATDTIGRQPAGE
jgi:hypothetical protein